MAQEFKTEPHKEGQLQIQLNQNAETVIDWQSTPGTN
jgi:hypothetical protein